MKPIILPEFTDLTTALSHTELKLHASQVHGLITGVLCGNFDQDTAWEEIVMGEKLTGDTREILQGLYDATAAQLVDYLFEFQMVLPADDDDLPLRAEALGVWCQGYLTGLKVAGVPVTDREPSELTEAIDDLIEIAKMNYDEVTASEEDEAAYAELVEYVRVAVIFIYQDLREDNMPHHCSDASHAH
jgi:yecA family protein